MLNNIYTFDTFVKDSENLLAYAACVTAAKCEDNKLNPTILYGPGGGGKTHLLYSVYKETAEKWGEGSVLYVDIENFIDEYVMPCVRDGIKSTDGLKTVLIDNAQYMMGKMAVQKEVYHKIKELCEDGKRVVIAMDCPLWELTEFADRLRTGEMEELFITEIGTPSRPFRRRFLREMCKRSEIELDNACINFLADNLPPDFRTLKGSIKMIKFHKSISPVDVDVKWIKRNIMRK